MKSEEKLSQQLQEDITWRIRELSELVRACFDSTHVRKEALLRAVIPVLYAHWEGYFVFASNSYLNFLCEKRIKITSLRDEFWAMTIQRKYKPQQISGELQFNRFLLDIRSIEDRIFKKGNFERINGASNLRSDITRHCCKVIGLDENIYNDYYDFLDHDLIIKRNFIAHGASLKFNADLVPSHRDKVIEMMRITQTAIENAAVTTSYLKSTVSP